MKDLIFIDIVVEHMQKMHKQITCESKEIDIMSKIGNQFVLKAKTVNEILVLSDLLKLLTGMTRSELTKEIRMREIQEMKEINEYVELKKEFLKENSIEEKNDLTKEHYLSVQKKPLIDIDRNLLENHIDVSRSKIKEIIPVINDNFILNKRLNELKKVEQRLKKLPKSQRGELVQIQKQINTIKSWL